MSNRIQLSRLRKLKADLIGMASEQSETDEERICTSRAESPCAAPELPDDLEGGASPEKGLFDRDDCTPNLIPLNSPIHSSDMPAEEAMEQISLDGDAAPGQDSKQLESLLQPVSEGSEPFLAMTCICCGGCVLVPIILLAVGGDNTVINTAVILFILGFLFCLWGMWPALLPPPPAPAEAYPLIHPTTIKKPKKVYVLVNPMGGLQGAAGTFEQVVAPMFQAHNIEVDKRETEYAGHATVLCKTLPLQGYDAIIAIGGDGTFHECVNGLMDRPEAERRGTAMGLVPGGSGNSFMTDFKLGADPVGAVENIAAGRLGQIDVTKVVYGPDAERHHKWSINVVGYCADHCMAAVNIDSWRDMLGTLRYDLCAVWGLLKGRSSDVKVYCDNKLWGEGVSALFVNTTQHFGKGMRAAPNARLDDGKLDVGNVAGTRGEQIRMFSLIKTGQAAALFDGCQASTVELQMPTPQGVFNVDGEPTVHQHEVISMTVHERALPFYVPEANMAASVGVDLEVQGHGDIKETSALPCTS